MEMKAFQELNAKRGKSWNPHDAWDINAWLVAIGGEMGEAMGIGRQLNRVRDGMKTRGEGVDPTVLRMQLVERLAHMALPDLPFRTWRSARRVAKVQRDRRGGLPRADGSPRQRCEVLMPKQCRKRAPMTWPCFSRISCTRLGRGGSSRLWRRS
jgi:hypothetical protein